MTETCNINFSSLALCDWLKKFAPFSQLTNGKRNQGAVLAHVFPRLAPVTCIASSSDWHIALFASDTQSKTSLMFVDIKTLYTAQSLRLSHLYNFSMKCFSIRRVRIVSNPSIVSVRCANTGLRWMDSSLFNSRDVFR